MVRKLFEPVSFGRITAKNRIVMAPMVTNFAEADDTVSDRLVSYYAERARSEIGTIVVEASPVRDTARIARCQVGSYDDRFVPGLSRLAETLAAAGAVSLLQLVHGGPKIMTGTGLSTVSVSSVGVQSGDVPRALSVEELRQVRRDFVSAARRCRQAGFDGVEIHAAHFYLLSAALSPFTNRRDDAYGGGIENRSRLTREVVEDIKSALGDDFCVWVRINACEKMASGLQLEDGVRAAARIAESGADAVHVSAYAVPIKGKVAAKLSIPVGGGPNKDTPPGPYLPYAAAVKKAVPVPVIAVGKLNDPALAEKALSDKTCDLIAIARQLLCDPYWALKIRDGREAETVRCKYCRTCHNALYSGQAIVCSQNLNLFGKPAYKQQEGALPENP